MKIVDGMSNANSVTIGQGVNMDRAISVIMLAGTIRPSALREKLDIPVLCLPMGSRDLLLDTWQNALAQLRTEMSVTVVLNSARDVATVEAAASDQWDQLEVIAEPAACRGFGGLLADVTADLHPDTLVVAIEANGLPPSRLDRLTSALNPSVEGLVGVCGVDQPAGVYVFWRSTVARIPAVGYCDMKEQFLPNLRHQGLRVRPLDLGDQACARIRDRSTYLQAVGESMQGEEGPRIMAGASVSGSAVIDGACIVGRSAVIEDGAVVHDSVVLSGATVGGGAIISRSVVGPLVEVPPRSQIVRQVVANDRLRDNTGGRRGWAGRLQGKIVTR
jgi:hypothetical protein